MHHVSFERLSFQALSQNCEKKLLTSSYLSARPSVLPHGTTRLSPDTFSQNFVFEEFRKFKCHYNLKRITGIAHEYLCKFMKISRSVLLKMKNISDKFVQKIKTHIFCPIHFFQKIVPFMAQTRQVTGHNIIRSLHAV